MEAPTGHHRLPQPGGRETVERGGEGGHQAGAPGPQHLHLVHHVVQPGARVEELTAQHHQQVLSPAVHRQVISVQIWRKQDEDSQRKNC